MQILGIWYKKIDVRLATPIDIIVMGSPLSQLYRIIKYKNPNLLKGNGRIGRKKRKTL